MKKIICAAVFVAAAILAHNPASAFSAGSLTATAIGTSGGMIEQVQGRRFGRPAVVVRPGVGRAVVVRPGPGLGRAVAVRPGFGYVNRPWRGRYWRPGVGWAVGSVVALGALTAVAAASYAPPPPGPGYCWYYTDPSYRAGYWAGCQ